MGKKRAKLLKNIFRWVGNIVLALLIAASVIASFSIIRAKKHPGEPPSFMGYKGMTVITGSMKPAINPGDVVIMKNEDKNRIKIGDVITYRLNKKIFVTHRVTKIVNKGEEKYFVTKGDANNTEDESMVKYHQIQGINVLTVPKGGYIAEFIRSPKGIVLVILIPIALLVLEELVKVSKEEKKQKRLKNS